MKEGFNQSQQQQKIALPEDVALRGLAPLSAVIMGPISVTIANQLGYPTEPFLMCVAIGASCAFLSPIGHQCNTLVMGPGNYKFGDYWKLGLPLELLIIAISTPLLLIFWF